MHSSRRPLGLRLGHTLAGIALALLPGALNAQAPAASGTLTPCGWETVAVAENPLQLLPSTAPPWIDPTFPCTCCVTGAKYGLGVFGAQDGAAAIVLYSLGTLSVPLGSQTLLIDPTQIVTTILLPADPVTPGFANVCWAVDDCLTLPENPALIGVRLYLQSAAPDPSPPHGWSLSNRLDLLIGTQF